MTADASLSSSLQERFARRDLQFFDRVLVVDQCESTQDIAKQACQGKPGMLVVAERQTAGRGRLGRAWADTSHLGVPATFVLDATVISPEHLSLIAGIAACATCEFALDYNAADLDCLSDYPTVPLDFAVRSQSKSFFRSDVLIDQPVAIRWPNDVVELTDSLTPGRKIAGVLIERVDGLVLVGIGVNVLHARSDWSAELATKATSLRSLGSVWSRADVAVQLVTSLNALLSKRPSIIAKLWNNRDVLVGLRQTFEHNNQRFTGTIKSIDPTNHILLQLDDGTTKSLPALTTSLVHDA